MIRFSFFVYMILLSTLIDAKEIVVLKTSKAESIEILKPALYPESLAYDNINNRFLVGSFRDGCIYEVSHDGSYKKFTDGSVISSALGVRIDTKHNRLYVANSDLGASINQSKKGIAKLASLAIYELSSAELLKIIDLGNLYPSKKHLANGITLDTKGNVYISDSFAPVIYKVDINAKASIFLEDKRFLGKGINLNGLVYHPDNYIIVAKKNDGVIFKIPLSNPKLMSQVRIDTKFLGADGLLLADNNNIVLIANSAAGTKSNKAVILSSKDNWVSAEVTGEYKFDDVYPTTGVIVKDKIYVLHSKLNLLIKASKDVKKQLQQKAVIEQIGYVKNK